MLPLEAHPGKPFVLFSRYAAGRTSSSAIIAAKCAGGSITTSMLVASTSKD
jgi:hypothetical protein